MCSGPKINVWYRPDSILLRTEPKDSISPLYTLLEEANFHALKSLPRGRRDLQDVKLKLDLSAHGSKWCGSSQEPDLLFLDHNVLFGEADPVHRQLW